MAKAGTNQPRNATEILTPDDIRFLSGCSQFGKLISEVRGYLDACRLEVDTVHCDKLPELQGRIRAYKNIITIFEEIYEQ